MATFEENFTSLLNDSGNHISILFGLADLLPDMPNLKKDFSDTHTTIVKAVTNTYLANISGQYVLTDLITSANTLITDFYLLIDQVTGIVNTAFDSVKITGNTAMIDVIKTIPLTVSVGAAISTIRSYTFAKTASGAYIIGKMDIDALVRNTLTALNVTLIVNSILGMKYQASAIYDQSRSVYTAV